MRILYQLASPMDKTIGLQEVARRQKVLQEYAGTGVEVAVEPTAKGPAGIESAHDAGLVVPERNPERLAEAIERLADDPVLRARLGACARERFRTQFAPARAADEFLKLYREVARPPGAPAERPECRPRMRDGVRFRGPLNHGA